MDASIFSYNQKAIVYISVTVWGSLKGPFCNLTMIFLWHSSVDIDKISLFPNFRSILSFRLWVMHVLLYYRNVGGNFHVDIIKRQFGRLFRETNEFARNILLTNIMYLKASADVKISTFLEKNGGMRLWITKWTFNHIANPTSITQSNAWKATIHTKAYIYVFKLSPLMGKQGLALFSLPPTNACKLFLLF